MDVYFTDFFQVRPDILEDYGAFDVSLINDLPLFIDPFLLFTSDNPEYRRLHDQIIDYLKFLRDQSVAGIVDDGLLKAWYMFPEVKQLWLGFSLRGNGGSGLGIDFARALHENLHVIFTNFGNEQITKGSHLEKVCLVQDGVGRDNISDFTANLIKEYLLTYTQDFARQHVPANLRRTISVPNVRFDYERRVWRPQSFELPYVARERDFVLLTPKDILTKDENWINRHDLMERFEQVANSVPDDRLRSEVNQYLYRQLTPKSTNDDRHRAYATLIRQHPQLIEWYIRAKEDQGGEAQRVSQLRVSDSEVQFVDHIRELIGMLVTVQAACSKHRRLDVLPLHPQLIEVLPEWLRGLSKDQLLFPKLAKRRTWLMVKKDLERVGIPYETPEGIADFHAAGRHTYITGLLTNGATLPEAKELARHTDVKMTMKYAHIGIGDRAKALANLPFQECHRSKPETAEGHPGASAGTAEDGKDGPKEKTNPRGSGGYVVLCLPETPEGVPERQWRRRESNAKPRQWNAFAVNGLRGVRL